MPGARFARIRAMIDQCYFSTHLSATWTGNHRNASVIFSYNPRISPVPRARTLLLILIYALLNGIIGQKKSIIHQGYTLFRPASPLLRALPSEDLRVTSSALLFPLTQPQPLLTLHLSYYHNYCTPLPHHARCPQFSKPSVLDDESYTKNEKHLESA